MVCSTYLERFPSSSSLSTTAPFCRPFFASKPLFLTDIAHHTRKLGMRPLFVAHDPYVDWRSWFCFYLVEYGDMLTGDFFRSWGLFHLQEDGDVAQVSSSVRNNFVNYIELQRNEEMPWARLTLKILFFMQILFFLEPGYTCFVCFSERWKSTLFNLKCI